MSILKWFAALACTGMANGYAQEPIRIGFISDLSSVYSDVDGKGGAIALQMAIDDFGGKVLGRPIELLVADHQNKADVAASKAREWFDQRDIQMLVGGTTTSAALAMARVAEEKKRIIIVNGSGAAALTNEQCSPYTIHYSYDLVALARGTGNALASKAGQSWFFLTADYSFGHELQKNTTQVIEEKKGVVKGFAKHPLNAPDFSSFIMQASNVQPDILAFANAGGDFINALKTAREFGLKDDVKKVGMVVFSSDIHSLGLKQTQGLMFTDSWHWDLNAESRVFADKFLKKFKKMPTSIHAADYSSMTNYLKAVDSIQSLDAEKLMGYMKSKPLDDFYGQGVIRPDGRYAHSMYLMQVKSPEESQGPWDYLKVLKTLSPEEVWIKKSETRCQYWM